MTPLDLHPSGVFNDPDLGFPSLIENVLIRCFFEPRTKERLSWIGIARRRGGPRAFTAKIRLRAGVYGLFYLGTELNGSLLRKGYFDIKYFPSIDEPAFEAFSFAENMVRLRDEFEGWLRTAPPEGDPVVSAFTVGRLCACIDAQDANLFLSLWAPNRWREYRKAGLTVTREDGSEVPCVPAGGLDRNVPAFALSWSFFDRLVASFAVQLGKSPSIVVFRRRPGWVSEISADGTQEIRESTEVKDKLLVAGFTSDDQGEAFDTWRQWAIRFQPDHWPDSPDDGSEIIYSVSGQVHRLKRFSFRWTPNIEAIPLTRRFDAPEGNKPPLIVITGFLGSGKTTLLNQMVESKALGYHRFVAVIQNELGPVAVDSGLTDGACNLVEITEGCVCCNLSGDLAKAVQKVCTGYKPDLILLETTGMLDPRSLLEEIPRLAPYARFDSLVSLVDASTFFRVLDEYSVVKEQIAAADLIILNKIDLVPKRDIDRLKATVAAINPRADVIPAVRADVPPDLLFSTAVLDRVGNRQHPAMPVSHEEGTQGYDVVAPHTHLAVDNVITFTVRAPGQLDREKTLSFLSALPKSVYRLKGVLAFAGEEQPKLVQYVAGRYDIEDFPQADISPNVIVFIGRGMDCDHLREALTLCASEADLDEPRV